MSNGTQLETNLGEDLSNLIQSLKLQPSGDNDFFGRIYGFPVAVQGVVNSEATGLLFHIRHPLHGESIPPVNPGPELAALIETGQAELEVDDRIVWLNFFKAGPLLTEGKLVSILLDTLIRLKEAGFCPKENICHKCDSETVAAVQFYNGRVQQICGTCFRRATKEVSLDPLNLPFIVGWGSVSAFLGAISWAGLWILYDKILSFAISDAVYIPRLVFVLICLAIGFLTALPTTFLLKKIPRRGDRTAGWFGAIFAIASIVVGECFYITWLVYKIADVISFAAGFRLLPAVISNGGWSLLGKLVAAIMAICIAYESTRPKKKMI